MSNEKVTVYDYDLCINGLFGRNRKVKFEVIPLIEESKEILPIERVKEALESKLKTLKPKGTFKIRVYQRKSTLENDSGVIFKSTNLFGDSIDLITETRAA